MAITATKDESYSDPQHNITISAFAGEAGGAATTEYCKFRDFMTTKLRAAHIAVTTAGTATTHAINLYHGTTSIGAVALSTATAGVTTSILLATPRSIAAMDQISVKSGADADGKVHVVYEYEYPYGALHN
jgi:hypothetical protein